MLKLTTVFGATGNQGGSVVKYILNVAELSKEFKIRGITRDTSKPAAQEVKDGHLVSLRGTWPFEEVRLTVCKGGRSTASLSVSNRTLSVYLLLRLSIRQSDMNQ